MVDRKRIAHGFTFVEILIVVVILGIFPGIVIPQFTSASETAKSSNMVSQLQTIRSQIELYQIQHNGNYPQLATLQTGDPDTWTGLTTQTNVNGAAARTLAPTCSRCPRTVSPTGPISLLTTPKTGNTTKPQAPSGPSFRQPRSPSWGF